MTNELPLGTAVLRLVVDPSALQSGMASAEKAAKTDIEKMSADASAATKPLTTNLQNVAKESENAGQSLGQKLAGGLNLSTGQLIRGAAAAAGLYVGILGVGQVVGRGLHDAIAGSIDDARRWNEIQAQTQSVLKSTGNAAGLTAQDIADIGNAFEKTTKYGNDQVQSMENVLLTFTNINKNVFPQTTGLILDISQALGQDLQQTAIQVGKALNDPAVGMANLQRIGVSFTKEQIDQAKAMEAAGNMAGAQSIILGELTREFGGSAAAAENAAGGVDVARNQFADAKRDLAEKLIPALQDAQTNVYRFATDAITAAENSTTMAAAFDAGRDSANGMVTALQGVALGLEAIATSSPVEAIVHVTISGLDYKPPGMSFTVGQFLTEFNAPGLLSNIGSILSNPDAKLHISGSGISVTGLTPKGPSHANDVPNLPGVFHSSGPNAGTLSSPLGARSVATDELAALNKQFADAVLGRGGQQAGIEHQLALVRQQAQKLGVSLGDLSDNQIETAIAKMKATADAQGDANVGLTTFLDTLGKTVPTAASAAAASSAASAAAKKAADDAAAAQKQLIDDATTANRSLFSTIATVTSTFQQQQIDALLKGGKTQLDAVKVTQAQQYAEIHATAERIQQALGVDLPTALKAAFASVTDAANAAAEAAKAAEDQAKAAKKEYDQLFGVSQASNQQAALAEFGPSGVGFSVSLQGGHLGVGGAAASGADAFMQATNALSTSLGRGLTAAEQQSIVDQLFTEGAFPHRALGGPVTAGQPYIVGELRPEVFVPDRNGTIAPDVASMVGGGSTVLEFHFHGPVTDRRGVEDFVVSGYKAAKRHGRLR